MGVECHWVCDSCGTTEIRSGHEIPSGWIVVEGRDIAHTCAGCAPSVGESSLASRLVLWVRSNPMLAAVALVTAAGLLVSTLLVVLSEWVFRALGP
jgi:hypothetical protein